MQCALFLIATTLATAGEFTTSLGDTYPYTISAMTTDSAGNTYVTGSRQLDFPFDVTDIFLSKLDPSGNLIFTKVFGASANSSGKVIAVDRTGNIYIAGTTAATDFPLSNALQTQPNGAFIMKLTNDGNTILYSTYFGGTLGGTSIAALATDSKGNLYLTGSTEASDFPHTSGMPFGPLQAGPSQYTYGAFITSISAAGDKILYSGAIVGTVSPGPNCGMERLMEFCIVSTAGVGIAVDAAGNAIIVGNTAATDLPTTAGVLAPTGWGPFVAKINAGGTGINYLTYLSPSLSTIAGAFAMSVDASGNIYIAEQTAVLKIKPDASAIVWKTTMGNLVQSVAVDTAGNVWATGLSYPNLIPNTNGWTTGTEFLVGLNSAGTMTYSALYPTGTIAQSVALDPSGLVHVAGSSGFVSAIAPSTAPTSKIFYFQNAAGGNITSRISPAEVIAIYGPGIGPTTPVTAAPTNGFYPTTLAGVQVTINGTNIPLLYVSANQINAVVPMALPPYTQATVRIINGTSVSPNYPVQIVFSAPQAFPTVLNQEGTINSQANPALGATTVTFYATGWQSDFSPLADGQVATAAQDTCQGGCQASAGSKVPYAGAAPGIVAGVTQLNVNLGAIPTSITPFQLQLSVTGTSTVTQSLWIK